MTQHFFASSGAHAPRTNLPRGKACMNCRRRKIKCDGIKPVCGQCSRSPGAADDCEYPLEGRSRTQQLEETIKKLQSRIGELEATANESSIFLHEPYESGVEAPPELPRFPSWSPSSPLSASSRVATPSSSSTSSSLVLEEPPSDVIERLVDTFLSNFRQFGFFLDRDTFRRSALLTFPFGHYSRPSPALLSAVYMWGARLSHSLHPTYNEEAFLSCTLQNIHQDLAGRHPHRAIHSIQAEVLLSVYFLTLGRPVEGIYHSSAAVSLAISAGLHIIQPTPHSAGGGSRLSPQPTTFGVLEAPACPPAADSLEEGERICAFWTVVIVNNYWVAAHGSPSAISYYDTPIDTPWPLELQDYVSPQLFDHVGASSGATVSKFLAGVIVDGFSPLALLAKASLLLERSITFSSRGRYADHSAGAFETLDVLLQQFVHTIPIGISAVGGPEGLEARPCLLVAHTIAHAAIIRLHAHRIHTSETSRGKYLSAARSVVHLMNGIDFSVWPTSIDPIMGILWTTVCEVFLSELSNMQQPGSFKFAQTYEDYVACLQTILATMSRFSSTSPLIDYFATRVKQTYNAVSGQ
ncbi:Zn(2)-Cys(6) binuclear cluster domain-containing protein [Roridomyces roridus]|uniref:Zn(2)-Cys(6) binuclear cluster domain-containing protein n=1 Tax=Roridomyces roridus TaxID=1738132 RepID=A0AAD7C3C0_9AGAR|nr:Zn(2)-Cys(6) binuclear cluster domain-containing protein [Roridomyces roridus]